MDGTLESFNAVFPYSSVEHSGLGRYGDPLNPWGDIISIAEAWCVSKPEAVLALSVPTYVSTGKHSFLLPPSRFIVAGSDFLVHNVHRMYGPVMYPYLVRQASDFSS